MKKSITVKSLIIIVIIIITLISLFIFSCKNKNDECSKIKNGVIKYQLNYIVEFEGILEGETSQTIVDGENSTSVIAIPNEGYRFVKWSDGNTEPTRAELNINFICLLYSFGR